MRVSALCRSMFLLAVCVATPSVHAQQVINLGSVVMTMGEARADVLQRLNRAFRADSAYDDTWFVILRGEANEPKNTLGSVSFDAGRLIYVGRKWDPTVENDTWRLMYAVLGALEGLTGPGETSCVVLKADLRTLDAKTNGINVTCADSGHTIRLSSSIIRGAAVFHVLEEWRPVRADR